MANYGIWQGMERATGNALATGMQLMQYQGQRQDAASKLALEKDRMSLLQESADREKRAFENSEKKRREQEDIENAFVPASMIAPKIHSMPKFKAMAVDAVRKAGFKVEEGADGEIYAPNKAFAYINNLLKTNTEFQKSSIENTLADLQDQSVSLTQQIAQAQQSGKADEKTLGPLQQQQLAIKKQIGEIISVRENVMAKMLENEAKGKMVEKTVDLGDKVEYIYTDGTRETKTKGAVPGSATPHNVIEVPSPNGETAQKMQYNPETKKYDIPVGPSYKVRSQVVNVNSPTASDAEVEVMASLLAEGKINPGDVSKRGSIAPKVFKRAQEINPSLDPRGAAAENAAYQGTISLQQKQIGQMGSFVKNMEKQVSRVKDIAKELKNFDARILNLPLRAVRGRIAGSSAQAKYDMYLTEIENEIGKLATGSAASISELSVGAQEKWAKIHDKNLSVKDMISLLEETSHAGRIRMESVKEQLAETRKNRVSGGAPPADPLGIR